MKSMGALMIRSSRKLAGQCLVLALACAVPVFATISPLPSSSLGIYKTLTMDPQSTGQLGDPVAGGGGQFRGTLDGHVVGLWCVDDQLLFQWGQSNHANVVLLNDIPANSFEVRYGNVTNDGTPHWTNNAGVLASISTAQQRYQMAAYLVQQYTGFDQSVASSAQDDAIQRAIWALTNNNSTNSDNSPSAPGNGSPLQQNAGVSAIVVGDDTTNGYWINQALSGNAYQAIDLTRWAVVSWGADTTGHLYTGGYGSSTPALQTFLVEVVPEPGFYGVLAIGLSSLLMFGRRKRS